MRLTAKFLLAVLFLLMSSVAVANHEPPEMGAISPCGSADTELDHLTKYWQLRWTVEYRDMTSDEIAHLLEAKSIENSEIIGVRVFKSRHHADYALVAYRLFQNFLDGKPLVQLHCIVQLNGAFGLTMDPPEFQELMGKTYEEIGEINE